MLNECGTFESDITAQRIAQDHYRLFVGTNAIKRDLAWFQSHSSGFEIELEDSTETYAVLGLMGPDAARIVAESGAPELNDLGYFKVGPAYIAGKHVRAARMSYVGEVGFEVTCKAENAAAIYAALTDAGATPAGLFAQTSMRIEKGFCAMGHELDSDISPIEAGLDFATRKTGGFIGSDTLEARRASGAKGQIVSLIFEDDHAVPLGHEPIYHNGHIIGQTSSCAFGYRVGRPIALGHVTTSLQDQTQVQIDIARQMFNATIALRALYDPGGSRMKT